MIKRLLLRNFQAHTKTNIKFTAGVNCIVGDSDIGKSAVVRGLSWICLNTPDGIGIIRHGQKEVRAKILVNDETITRSRTKSKNQYFLGKQEYVAFGRNAVPNNIEKILELNSINFQGQHDGAFWFSETAGEVSRQLNKIVNLDIIDTSLSFLKSAVTKAGFKVEESKDRIEKYNTEIKELDWIKSYAKEIESLKKLDEAIEKDAKFYDKLNDLIIGANAFTKSIKLDEVVVEQGDPLLELFAQVTKTKLKVFALYGCLKTSKKLRKQMQTEIPDTQPIIDLNKSINQQCEKQEILSGLLTSVSVVRSSIELEAEQLKIDEKELHDTMQGTCPVCKKELG